jgi:signal transduction histidine kinase
VDFAALMHRSLQAYTLEADKRGIRFDIAIDENLPTAVVDYRRIDQVLENLLSNAFKFTEAGDAIEVTARGDESSEVIVAVKDSGMGIPQEGLAHLFELYGQVEGGARFSRKGTGLGLAICKKIVEAHSGRIWVESELGKGSTFYFSLPGNVDEREAQWETPSRPIHP